MQLAVPAFAAPDLDTVVPYFHAEQASGVLTASGSISSEAHAEILHEVAAELFDETSMLRLGQPAQMPAGWASLTEQVVRALVATDRASAEVDGTTVVISGINSDEKRWQRAAEAVTRSLLPGMRLMDRVYRASDESFAALCQRQFEGALAHRAVRFPPSGSSLGPGAEPLLDALVEIAADCPAARIFVTGHADGTGNLVANVALSQARANAVARYMTEHGVAASRLTATGIGSARPVNTGGNARARAANRRIEFRMQIDD